MNSTETKAAGSCAQQPATRSTPADWPPTQIITRLRGIDSQGCPHHPLSAARESLGDLFFASLPGEDQPRLFVFDPATVQTILADAERFGLDKSLQPGQDPAETPAEISNLVQPMFLDTLFDMDGEPWRQRRNALKGGFAPQPGLQASFNHLCQTRIAIWLGNDQRSGQLADVQTELYLLLVEAACHTLFGADHPLPEDLLTKARSCLSTHVTHYRQQHPGNAPDPTAARVMRAACAKLLDDYLRHAADSAPDSPTQNPIRRRPLASLMQTAGLSHQEQVSTLLNYLIAAAESTASAASHMLAHVAADAQLQTALHAECLSEGPPRLAEATVREALRLRAPATLISRRARCTTELTVGQRTLSIPSGTRIAIYVSAMHRDPRSWGGDAHRFRPQRFLGQATGGAPAGAYVPFSRGPRACAGAALATHWLKVLLKTTVEHYRLGLPEIDLDQHLNKFVTWLPALPLDLQRRPPAA